MIKSSTDLCLVMTVDVYHVLMPNTYGSGGVPKHSISQGSVQDLITQRSAKDPSTQRGPGLSAKKLQALSYKQDFQPFDHEKLSLILVSKYKV